MDKKFNRKYGSANGSDSRQWYHVLVRGSSNIVDSDTLVVDEVSYS